MTRLTFRLPLLMLAVVLLAAAPARSDATPELDPFLTRLLHGWGVRLAESGSRLPIDAAELRMYSRRLAIDAESSPPRVRVWMRLSPAARDAADKIPGVALQARIGALTSAIVELPRLADLAALPGLVWMKVPPRPRPELDVSVPASGGDVVASTYDLKGRGITIGLVDSGLDFTHDDFRNNSGTTRISFLWDQTVDCGNPPAPFTYGCLYTRSEINDTLDGMGSVSFPNSDGHGSHVAGVAASNGKGTGNGQPANTYVGMAELSPIIAVKVFPEPGDDCPLCDVGDALCFIDEKSDLSSRPWIANLSLGFDRGGHDGSDAIEQVIDTLTGPGIPGKAVVKSAGNNGGLGIHISGTVGNGISNDHTFELPFYVPAPGTFDDLQVWQMWYDGDDDMTVRITTPNGSFLQSSTDDCACFNPTTQQVGGACAVDADCDTGAGFICNGFFGFATGFEGVLIIDKTCAPTANGSRWFELEVDDQLGQAPFPGTWTFRVTGNTIIAGGDYDAWIWFSQFSDTAFPVDWDAPDFTNLLTLPGTAQHVTTVGSYTTKVAWTNVDGFNLQLNPLPTVGERSDFSSPGPTRDGRVKPEITAPGQLIGSVLAADAAPTADPNFVLQDGVHSLLQGTSFAAPHVVGFYAQALELDPTLDATQLRTLVTGGALTDGFTGAVPNDDWGHGKLDADAALNNLIKPIPDLVAVNASNFSFSGIPQADTYDVFRVDLSLLDGSSYGFCLAPGQGSPAFSDGDTPAVGDGFGYTVAGVQDGVNGLIGFQSDGSLRPRPPCP